MTIEQLNQILESIGKKPKSNPNSAQDIIDWVEGEQ